MDKIILDDEGKATLVDITKEQLLALGYVVNDEGYWVKPGLVLLSPAEPEKVGNFFGGVDPDEPEAVIEEASAELEAILDLPPEQQGEAMDAFFATLEGGGVVTFDGEVQGEWTPPWQAPEGDAVDPGNIVNLLHDKLMSLEQLALLTNTQFPSEATEEQILALLQAAFPQNDPEAKAIEAPVVEEVPEEPKPTCRFFAPAASLAEGYAAIPAEDWPYDRLFGFHACTCPAMNKRGELACAAVNRQAACMFYEASEPVTLTVKQVRPSEPMGVPFEVKELTMVENRYGYGTPVVLIHSEGLMYEDDELPEDAEVPEPELLHRADAQQHGDKLREVAQSLLEVSIQDMGDVVVEDQPVPEKIAPQPKSYIKELVS